MCYVELVEGLCCGDLELLLIESSRFVCKVWVGSGLVIWSVVGVLGQRRIS